MHRNFISFLKTVLALTAAADDSFVKLRKLKSKINKITIFICQVRTCGTFDHKKKKKHRSRVVSQGYFAGFASSVVWVVLPRGGTSGRAGGPTGEPKPGRQAGRRVSQWAGRQFGWQSASQKPASLPANHRNPRHGLRLG